MPVSNFQNNEKSFHISYKDADKFVVVNSNDKDVTPIVLRLPDPPDIHYIDGYGLLHADQYWKRLEIPTRLVMLEKRAMDILANDLRNNKRELPNGYKLQKIFWELLEEGWSGYEEEVNFIKRVQWYLTYGYWFYNDGKPTWITPWHFRYLQFWYMQDVKGHYPEYRDVDRRLEIFAWYNYTATETFANLDENGIAQPDEDGNFLMKDIGYRTSFGIQNPKRRRRGDTQRGLNKLVWIMERRRGGLCPIVADTGDHAEKIFKEKLIPALREEPVWLKPLWGGSYDTNSIICVPPGNIYFEDFLDSAITITDTSTERANDSRKLYGLLSDEEGKGAARADVGSRWEINKLTMAQDDIHGYSEHPSTVEDMCAGGSEYEAMWYQSNFYVRNKGNGQTKSGLSRIYVSAQDGLDGFIDRFGMSVIDDPTERQIKLSPHAKFARLNMGAKEYLESDLIPLLMTGKASDQKLYRERIRKNPMESAHMWTGTSGDLGFDYQIIDRRIIELKRQPLTKRYDLFWADNIPDTKVMCRENPNGDFVMPSNVERFINVSNQWTYGATVWNERKQVFENQRMPMNGTLTTAGADPFGMGSPAPGTKGGLRKSQYSDGGFSVKETGNETEKDIKEWTLHNFVCYYQCRKNVFDYYEDIIKGIVFFNSLLAFERNREGLWNYLVDRGYGGYMKYQAKGDGTYESKPGFYAGAQNKENLFLEIINHIAMHGHREKILEFLIDCRQIKSMDDMTKYDGWTACGWAALGAKSPYGTSTATINTMAFDWDKLYEAPYSY
jgi:hypothetical protein